MGILGEGNPMWDFDEGCCIAAKLTSSFAWKMANLQWQVFRKVDMYENWNVCILWFRNVSLAAG